MAVGGTVALDGFRLQTALPVADTDRVTVPLKLPRAATVTVEVPPGDPTFAVTLAGLALMSMPPELETVTVIVAVVLVIALSVPPVP